MIDRYKRKQVGWKLHDLYPTKEKTCACGCGEVLTGRKKRWASINCADLVYVNFAILKGNTGIIRKELFKTEKGFCRNCGLYDDNWQADHIIPVFLGGGGCDLSNYQTLCLDCHKEKTLLDRIPNSNNVKTGSLYVTPTLLDALRARDEHVVENIIG